MVPGATQPRRPAASISVIRGKRSRNKAVRSDAVERLRLGCSSTPLDVEQRFTTPPLTAWDRSVRSTNGDGRKFDRAHDRGAAALGYFGLRKGTQSLSRTKVALGRKGLQTDPHPLIPYGVLVPCIGLAMIPGPVR